MKVISFYMVMMMVMVAYANPEEKYREPNDVNIEEVINTPRLFHGYYLCLSKEGKCTPYGKELKENMPDALANGCAKCTENHMTAIRKVIKFMIENKPEEWKKLKSIYDPEGIYAAKYEKELKELQA
uniref:Chemosensory protein 18 n=1 Tax=Ectropis obliqua TaxID=248899 RepID=A0A1L2BL86_ECTOB|nr:chemosensory protein 18 [Ectropis obliqua]